MKRNLLCLLTLLMVVGWSNVWAQGTIIFDFEDSNGNLFGNSISSNKENVKNSTKEISSSPITMTLISTNSERGVSINKENKQVKFEGKSGVNEGAMMKLSCTNGYAITKVLVKSADNYPKNFSANKGTYSATTSSPYVGTWTGKESYVLFDTSHGNVDQVTSIEVTYAVDDRSTISTFAFNRNEVTIRKSDGTDIFYINNSVMNTGDSDPFEFIFESGRPVLKMKVNLTDNLSLSTLNAATNSTYFTVTSSDNTVINVDGVTHSVTGEGTSFRYYFDNLQVLKVGTTTLTFKFLGSSSHQPIESSVVVNVKDLLPSYMQTGTPYTWNFAGGDWTNTKIQVGYQSSVWTIDGNSAYPTSNTLVPDWSGIEIIRWLEFNLPANNDLYLNWNDKKLWLDQDVKITFPSLPIGKIIIIRGDKSNFSIVEGGTGTATISGNVITITGEGTIKVNMNEETSIYSIYVGDPLVATWSYTPNTERISGDTKDRATSGTFTFTGEGSLAGGKVINEVPGITMKIGADGANNWTVRNCGTNESPVYAAFCPDRASNRGSKTIDGGCFYRFTPYVNGYLTVNTRTGNISGISPATSTGYMFVYEGITKVSGDINYQTGADYNITFPLIAGHVYDLCCQNSGFDLHSFTFRPAFLNPTTNTDQLSITDATYGNKFVARIGSPAKNAFPKLINPSSTEQQNKVKFASDKDKVYLYKNNDVEIIGNGENILVRGTVLDKNNEDGLVAYYYLNAYVLTVTSYELEDQEYIATNGLTDGKYQIEFSGNIQAVGSSVVVQIMKDNETVQNVTATITDKILYIPFDAAPFASLEEGATYRITIPENSIALTADAETKNSAIERTFSVNKEDELQVKMIYPTNIATVGTTIVLATYLPDGSASNLNDKKKVKAILSASGESDMELSATFSGNQMAFKPTRTLSYNKEYTLTINYNADNNVITSLEVNSTIYKVTHSKVFKFTTGSSSGTSPVVTETSPVANAVIPGTAYSGGTISFTFNQAVELEPYSEVKVTPINGSEATTTGKTFAPDNAAQNTLVLSNGGKTVSFVYSADGLKYDVYYQVVIPANTVIGAGGLPNSEPITLHFRMAPKPSSSCKVSSTAFTGYPYSWDFTKFGTQTSTISDLTANAPDPTTGSDKEKKKATTTASRWQTQTSNSVTYYANYWTNGMEFPQGEVLTYRTAKAETPEEVEMAEVQGLRWSLASRNSSGANARIAIPKSSGYCLKLVGGTHYMTIPEVGSGKKIYIRAQVSSGNVDSRFNINSDNAVFADNFRDGNNKLGVRDGNVHVYKVNVTGGGDVTFCLQDVSFYQIAVAVDDAKKFNDYKDKSYTTEFRPNATERYDLSEILGGYSVTAKVPTAASVTDEEEKTGKLTLTEAAVIPSATPVILVCSSTDGPSVPLFAADVNTATPAVEGKNLLVGNPGPGKIYAPVGSYILTTQYRDIDQNGNPRGEVQTGPLAFYRVYKANYNGIAANRAYLSDVLHPGASGAKLGYYFVGDDDTPTVISQLYQDDRLEEDGSSTYYNINGQKLSGRPTVPGIYISNGKKIIIK